MKRASFYDLIPPELTISEASEDVPTRQEMLIETDPDCWNTHNYCSCCDDDNDCLMSGCVIGTSSFDRHTILRGFLTGRAYNEFHTRVER